MNKWFIGLLFIASTSFFIYQHSTGYSWDFSVYYMNSRYFLAGSGFYEWGRPPLASFLMFFGEYSYIILVSILGLLACLKFSKVYKLRPEVFYAFILTPYTIMTGFSVGTEYLVLSLTLLFFAFLKSELSGFFLGLTTLAHYSSAINGLFLFFSGKKFFKALILVVLVNLPWFLFNYVVAGDPFYSFLNQYALDITMRRDYIVTQPQLTHFLLVASFTIPFFIFGLFKFDKKFEIDWLMLLFFGLRLFSYFFIPLKEARYLFMILLPVAYFSTKGLKRFNYRVAFVVVILTLFFCSNYYYLLEDSGKYFRVKELINDSCMVMSNSWVFLNYFGVSSAPSVRAELVNESISKGYTIILFKHIWDPTYVFNDSFITQFPIVHNTSEFYVINDESVCLQPFTYNKSFIQEVNNTFVKLFNETFSFTIWDVIS